MPWAPPIWATQTRSAAIQSTRLCSPHEPPWVRPKRGPLATCGERPGGERSGCRCGPSATRRSSSRLQEPASARGGCGLGGLRGLCGLSCFCGLSCLCGLRRFGGGRRFYRFLCASFALLARDCAGRVVALFPRHHAGRVQKSQHAIGRQRTFRQPRLDLVEIELEALRLVVWEERVKKAEPLDKAAIPRRAAVCDHDVIDRPFLCSGAS